MKTSLLVACIAVLCAFNTFGVADDSASPVVDPAALGNIAITLAGNETHLNYLGLSSQSAPSLSQVDAERLVVVVFNSFCTICQAEANMLNVFYTMIEDDPSLKGRTKMIGIAAGNTSAEVEDFRKSYQVPFPLVPDPDFALNSAVRSNLRIPMVITARLLKGRSLEVLQTHLGEAKSIEDLLGRPVRSTRLETKADPSAVR